MDTDSLWAEHTEIPTAEIVPDVDAPDLLPTYTYRVPDHLAGAVRVGVAVLVDFGGKDTLGCVFRFSSIRSSDPLFRHLKDILSVVESSVTFDSEQAAVASWIADRYVCDLASALRGVAPSIMGARVRTRVELLFTDLPQTDSGSSVVQTHILRSLRGLGGSADLEALRSAANVSAFAGSFAALVRKGAVRKRYEIDTPQVTHRTARVYDLPPTRADRDHPKVSPAGQRILDALSGMSEQRRTPALPETILSEAGSGMAALRTLVSNGLVTVSDRIVRRAPLTIPATRSTQPTFTAGQLAAVDELGRALTSGNVASAGEPRTVLLFGVTASGKTEVYLDAIGRTLHAGRTALVLVPEIALTTQVVEVFVGRFGDEVAVLHSSLSSGERHDEWRRIQERGARIVVGARSAVFAPLPDIGLIIVDEEHEASYKQENLPRYFARDVAQERARLAGATLVLGSATPSMETYYATEHGAIARVEMKERVHNRPLPQVAVVDLREEMKEHRSLFSRLLIEEMGERLGRKQQTILFLNRRGYAQFVLCRDCGHVPCCPHCAVSLTFHAARLLLRCHHCDYAMPAPVLCPQCSGARIKAFGVGTEKVEEEVRKWHPNARVARLDRDTTSRKGAHAGILGEFRRGDADILIGTQMVAKGLDFPNVTLVGVISADTGINVPDFRAAERTFQLLTQVAGRAGRGRHPGSVVIQTFNPEHYSVQCATTQDYPAFYRKEIGFREELRYPPFSRLANLVVSDVDSTACRDRADVLAKRLHDAVPTTVEIIGPAPAPLSRLKGLYRRHVVVRAPVDAPISEYVRAALAKLSSSERAGISVDIDPMGLA